MHMTHFILSPKYLDLDFVKNWYLEPHHGLRP